MKISLFYLLALNVAVLALVIAVAFAAPQDKDAHVLRNELDNIGVDGYKWAYETSNGIAAQEEGHLENAGSENEAIAVSGNFKYVGPDNVEYAVNYVADKDGFHAQGEHIPTK